MLSLGSHTMILKAVNQTKTGETQGYCLLFFKDYKTDQREADKEKVQFSL